jgi:hypothetical protein
VYDMYPWDESGPASAGPAPAGPAPAGSAPAPAEPAVRAVQFALDRRDNGGDATGAAGQPPPIPARQ